MILKELERKYVYVKLNNDKIYTGTIQEVEFVGYDELGVSIYIISMIDKFGNFVSFSSKEFKFIEEQKKKEGVNGDGKC